MARPTIVDIARAAGVSKGAVSFALNGRPGVSEETRARVIRIATEMGWLPNVAARSLAGTRAGAIGLVFARPAETLGAEPFFMQLIAGIERELSPRSLALVFQVVEDHAAELAVYRRWAAERRVDGLLVVDPYLDDDRLAPLAEIGIPAVFVGVPRADVTFGGVWSNESLSMDRLLEHLAGLGHRRIARVAGSERHEHVAIRDEAFLAWVAEHGLDEAVVVGTDYSAAQGADATRELLGSRRPPTAILYDNDVMALSGLAVAQSLGVAVPGDVSLVAWDDSPMCQVSHPTMAALTRNILDFGASAAKLLLSVLDGDEPHRVETPAGQLVVRGSLGPPRATDAAS